MSWNSLTRIFLHLFLSANTQIDFTVKISPILPSSEVTRARVGTLSSGEEGGNKRNHCQYHVQIRIFIHVRIECMYVCKLSVCMYICLKHRCCWVTQWITTYIMRSNPISFYKNVLRISFRRRERSNTSWCCNVYIERGQCCDGQRERER